MTRSLLIHGSCHRRRSLTLRAFAAICFFLAGAAVPARPAEKSDPAADAFLYESLLGNVDRQRVHGELMGLVVPARTDLGSRQIDAFGYKLLLGRKFKTILLLYTAPPLVDGGVVMPQADSLPAPGGALQVDTAMRQTLEHGDSLFRLNDDAHQWSEIVRIQLGFLGTVVDHKKTLVLPLGIALTGAESTKDVSLRIAGALEALGRNKGDVLVLMAADLSQGFPRAKALVVDSNLLARIEQVAGADLQSFMEQSTQGLTLSASFPDWGPLLTGVFVLSQRVASRGQALMYANSAQFLTAKKVEAQKSTGLASVAFVSGASEEVELPKDRTLKLVQALPDSLLMSLVQQSRAAVNQALEPTKETLRPLPEKKAQNRYPVFVSLFSKDNQVVRQSGTLAAQGPLEASVKFHAAQAALISTRGPSLKKAELDALIIGLDIPSKPERARPDEIIQGMDGVVANLEGRKEVFLPEQWQLCPHRAVFLSELMAQMGVEPWRWSTRKTRLSAFQVLSIREGENKGHTAAGSVSLDSKEEKKAEKKRKKEEEAPQENPAGEDLLSPN